MQDSLPAGGLRLYREGVEPSGPLRKVSGHISVLPSRICPVASGIFPKEHYKPKAARYQNVAQTTVWATVWPQTFEIGPGDDVHEYCVLATSLVEDLASFGQLYRDRGDAENIFDELKNQWGWGGFTTHDLARCRLAARLVALFYNWWNIFVRLAEPDWHREAITSRPLLLHAIATRSRHARQTTLTVASSHAKSVPAAKALCAVAMFLRALVKTAEQLTASQRWAAILARAFQAFLNGRPLRRPPRLAPS